MAILAVSATALSGICASPARALQCVPYARAESGIDLRGDAWRWWNAAAGIYERGHTPLLGAVIVFRKFGKMRLGHVAVVKRVIDSRNVLVDHANWGPRGAGRGSVSRMVAVRDVSPHNDWTEVQVWNRITHELGTRTYPTYGFIYRHGRTTEVASARESAPEAIIPEKIMLAMAAAAQTSGEPDASGDQSAEFRLAPRAAQDWNVVTVGLDRAQVAELIDEFGTTALPPRPEVFVEALETPSQVPAPMATSTQVIDDDHAAALRAGSGRY